MKKNLISFLLVICMLFSSALANEIADMPSDDAEIQRAVSYGFVLDSWQDDWNQPVTYDQFCTILVRMLNMTDDTLKTPWPALDESTLSETIPREEAMIACMLAGLEMGLCEARNFGTEQQLAKGLSTILDSKIYPDWNHPVMISTDGNGQWDHYLIAAAFYGMRQTSLITGMSLFTLKGDNLRAEEALTRKEAVLAVIRLFESASINAYSEEKSYTIDPYELNRAIQNGLVPEKLQGNLHGKISVGDYCGMLTSVLDKLDPQCLPQWNKDAANAFSSSRPLTKDTATLAMYIAACLLGQGKEPNFTWGLTNEQFNNTMSLNYPDFPQAQQNCPFYNGNWSYSFCGFLYAFGQTSRVSALPVFDLDFSTDAIHMEAVINRGKAIASILRFYESMLPVKGTGNADILARAEALRQSILNSPTEAKYKGKAYYVSNNGSDANNGSTPETAWATLEKVNQAKLKKGDAVFFERGGLWRGHLACKPNVTYSAYGEGVKPVITLSPENGTGAEKWTLFSETADSGKIWVYHIPMEDLGAIVFNEGESWAVKKAPYWNGKAFMTNFYSGEAFDVTRDLDTNLTFHSPGSSAFPDNPNLDVFQEIGGKLSDGPLYLRCDTGNPGEVYSSIEFSAAGYSTMQAHAAVLCANGCVIDNLAVRYSGNSGIGTCTAQNIVIRNCDVSWCGGASMAYSENSGVVRCGDCIVMDGSHNSVINCYLHDCWDGGVTIETNYAYGLCKMDHLTVTKNLIERTGYGIQFTIYEGDTKKTKLASDIEISSNYIMFSGNCWGMAQKVITEQNASIDFDRNRNPNNGTVYVKDNIVYESGRTLLYCCMPEEFMPKFSGNTWAQYPNGLFAYGGAKGEIRSTITSPNALEAMEQYFGETGSKIIVLK